MRLTVLAFFLANTTILVLASGSVTSCPWIPEAAAPLLEQPGETSASLVQYKLGSSVKVYGGISGDSVAIAKQFQFRAHHWGALFVLLLLCGAAIFDRLGNSANYQELKIGRPRSPARSSSKASVDTQGMEKSRRQGKLAFGKTMSNVFGKEVECAERDGGDCVMVFTAAPDVQPPTEVPKFGRQRSQFGPQRSLFGFRDNAARYFAFAKAAFLSPGRHHYESEEDLKARFRAATTHEEYNRIAQACLAELLQSPRFGLIVESFRSQCGKRTLWRLSLPIEDAELQAAHFEYRMPLSDYAYEHAKMSKPVDDEGREVYAFMPYTVARGEQGVYHEFSHRDRLKLLCLRLEHHVSVQALIEQGVLLEFFATHYALDVETLLETWSNPFNWYQFPHIAIIDEVREYFGEELAWMFLWQRFYMKWLAFPAVIGGIAFFRLFCLPPSLHTPVLIIVAVIMSIWIALFNVYYTRHEARARQRWGIVDAANQVHPEYNPNLEDSLWPTAAVVLGDVLIVVMVLLTVIGIALIQSLKFFSAQFGAWHYWIEIAIPILTSTQVLLTDYAWIKLSRYIVKLQNHKLRCVRHDAWIYKVAIFRIFNNLYPFVFVGLIQPILHPETCEQEEEGLITGEGCLIELRMYLFVYFLLCIARDIFVNVGMVLFTRLRLAYEDFLGHGTSNHANLQAQSRLLEFDDEYLMDDWTRLLTSFLFLTCFNVAMPVLGGVVLLTNMFAVRFSAYKYCRCIQRPLPVSSPGIGAWLEVLKLIEHIALQVNICFIICVLDPVRSYSYKHKLQLFIFAENAIVLLKLMSSSKLPSVPSDVQEVAESNQRIQFSFLRPVNDSDTEASDATASDASP